MDWPERKANVCKIKVWGVKMFVSPSMNFRTTKGGKRILLDQPEYTFNCELFCDEIPQLRTREYVLIGHNAFMYSADTKNNVFKLRNAEMDSKIAFEIDTREYIDVPVMGRVVGEGSTP